MDGGHLVTAILIFVLSLLIVRKVRGRDTLNEWLIGCWISFVATICVSLVVFSFCVFFVSPVQIYNGQVGQIHTLTNELQIQTGENSDLVGLNRPQLDPVLIVDSVNSNSVVYHFEVQNIGKLTAVDIKHQVKTSGMQDVELNLPWSSHLAAGAKMVINDPLFEQPLPSDNEFSTDLLLEYRFDTRGLHTNFQALFRYSIPKGSLHPGSFFYWTAQETPSPDKVFRLQDIVKTFALPQAVIFLVAKIGSEFKTGSEFNCRAGNKYFEINPSEKTVKFESVTVDGKRISFIKNFATMPDKLHIITLLWTITNAEMRVDGFAVDGNTNHLQSVR